ncbi:hypothetical protein [Nonomuraea wenchangensis]|uniref:hypothetical protein n=1 Tax=Nonomuraea wenchangensis TaxID=568860 RepID=UPI00331F9E48
MSMATADYDDGTIRCDDHGITRRRYHPHRPKKDTAPVLDVGRRVRPTITPDDAAAVACIITEHGQR